MLSRRRDAYVRRLIPFDAIYDASVAQRTCVRYGAEVIAAPLEGAGYAAVMMLRSYHVDITFG